MQGRSLGDIGRLNALFSLRLSPKSREYWLLQGDSNNNNTPYDRYLFDFDVGKISQMLIIAEKRFFFYLEKNICSAYGPEPVNFI